MKLIDQHPIGHSVQMLQYQKPYHQLRSFRRSPTPGEVTGFVYLIYPLLIQYLYKFDQITIMGYNIVDQAIGEFVLGFQACKHMVAPS